jgi:hypothetical protein
LVIQAEYKEGDYSDSRKEEGKWSLTQTNGNSGYKNVPFKGYSKLFVRDVKWICEKR